MLLFQIEISKSRVIESLTNEKQTQMLFEVFITFLNELCSFGGAKNAFLRTLVYIF